MTMALGASTLELVDRQRVKHGQFVDGEVRKFEGCSVQPVGSSEAEAGLTTVATWNVWAPPDFPTKTENVVRFNGIELQIDGELQTFYDDLSGVALYVTGQLTRWKG
jgi:hypothetical protein